MARERWGAFSVIDHKDTTALIPEILLYDRLLIPVPYQPPTYDGDPSAYDDRPRWEREGWDPEKLYKRLNDLGDLAVKTTWNTDRQKAFHLEIQKIKNAGFEVNNMVQFPYAVTRAVLTREQPTLPSGITHVDVVAAYQSEGDFEADFSLESANNQRDIAKLGLLLGHKLAIPDEEANPEKALNKAISLARDADFKKKRLALYDWQVDIIRNKHFKPEEAIKEMDSLVDKYNEYVKKAVGKVAFKFAFTVAGIGLSLAGAGFNPLVAAGALLSLVQFAAFDGKPVIEDETIKPAAMFHTVEYSRANIYHKIRTFI